MSEHLLLIDDDVRLADMVGEFLRHSDYRVTHAPDAKSGLDYLEKRNAATTSEAISVSSGETSVNNHLHQQVDFVILDWMLPDLDGLEVCRKIRALPPAGGGEIPILMLTAKGDPMDRVLGLEMGADDYLPKPFEPRELLARIRAILRRRHLVAVGAAQPAHNGGANAAGVLRFGSLEINPASRQVKLRGSICDLTSYQFDLLLTLAKQAGRVLSRDQIMEALRGRELEAFDRSIDVHIGRIRLAIEADMKNPQRILTVRGVGYVLAKQQD